MLFEILRLEIKFGFNEKEINSAKFLIKTDFFKMVGYAKKTANPPYLST